MWLNIAAKLVPGIIKTGMSIASNRRKTKELESVAELKLAERKPENWEKGKGIPLIYRSGTYVGREIEYRRTVTVRLDQIVFIPDFIYPI